jgi:hypothetical protein
VINPDTNSNPVYSHHVTVSLMIRNENIQRYWYDICIIFRKVCQLTSNSLFTISADLNRHISRVTDTVKKQKVGITLKL